MEDLLQTVSIGPSDSPNYDLAVMKLQLERLLFDQKVRSFLNTQPKPRKSGEKKKTGDDHRPKSQKD